MTQQTPENPPSADAGCSLAHAMNCGGYAGWDEDCTCGLEWRIALRTEQEMHRAWRKRAEEAEAKVTILLLDVAKLKHDIDCGCGISGCRNMRRICCQCQKAGLLEVIQQHHDEIERLKAVASVQ